MHIEKKTTMNVDIFAIVFKLQNSGYGWICKDDLARMINMILAEIEVKPSPKGKNEE